MKKKDMTSKNVALRTAAYIVEFLDKQAKEQDRSRNYVINQFLISKYYELSGDVR